MASWSLLEFPKMHGGLGVGNILHKNLALLFKWLWRLFNDSSSLWSQLVRVEYKYGSIFSDADITTPPKRGPWRDICSSIVNNPQACTISTTKVRKKLGNGGNTYLWPDIWVGDLPLKKVYPRLFKISTAPDALVASNGLWNGLNWSWSLSWVEL